MDNSSNNWYSRASTPITSNNIRNAHTYVRAFCYIKECYFILWKNENIPNKANAYLYAIRHRFFMLSEPAIFCYFCAMILTSHAKLRAKVHIFSNICKFWSINRQRKWILDVIPALNSLPLGRDYCQRQFCGKKGGRK